MSTGSVFLATSRAGWMLAMKLIGLLLLSAMTCFFGRVQVSSGSEGEAASGYPWFPVAVKLGEVTQQGQPAWKSEDEFSAASNEVLVELTQKRAGYVGIALTNVAPPGEVERPPGYDIKIRLLCNDTASIDAYVCAKWWSDVGASNSGDVVDINGVLRISLVDGGPPYSVAVAYRLSGLVYGITSRVSTTTMKGEFVVAIDDPRLDEVMSKASALRESESQTVGMQAPEFLVGAWTVWPNGKVLGRGWLDVNGMRCGEWTTWWDSGTLQSVCVYSQGIREGPFLIFALDGSLQERGSYVRGLREGEWVEFEPLGGEVSKSSGFYLHGMKQGEWIERWQDGSVRERGSYEHGLETGLWTGWRRNGTKRYEGQMVEGVRRGRWLWWDGSSSEPSMVREY